METLTDPAATPVEEPTQVETPVPVEDSPAAPFPTQETPPELAPVPVEAEPEPVVPDPEPCSITLVTGQKHDVADRPTLIKEIYGAAADGSSPWVALERPGLSNLVVRASAIIAYE